MKAPPKATALLLWALLNLAAAPGVPPTEAAPETESRGPRRTIVLVVMDTTRLDEIGAYGGDARVAPGLDGLAGEGLAYSSAFSTDSLTLSSHLALFTGGLTGTETAVSKESETLAERLQRLGFRTIGISANWVLDADSGFDRGFDSFTNAVDPVTRELVAGHEEVNAEKRRERATAPAVAATLEDALQTVGASDSLFVFLNLLDPHDPYTPAAPYKRLFAPRVHVTGHLRAADGTLSAFFEHAAALPSRDRKELRQLYRAEVAQADRGITAVRALLRRLGRDGETLYVVTADHGELFGERGCWTHNVGLSEEEVHVPLIVRGPGIPRGRQEEKPVSLADIGPAIAAYAGSRSWEPAHRRPLLYHHIYSVNDPTSDPFNKTDLVGYVDGDWRVVRSQAGCRLYRRARPYWAEEPCDRDAGRGAALLAKLNDQFRAQVGAARIQGWLSEKPSAEWLKKLRSLGYLNN